MSSYLALLSFAVLGFALEMHLVFVNVIIGATVLTVVTRYLAYLRRDPGLESVAKGMFRLMVVTELFGGVWGTILTVFMAGLFPSMTAIFTRTYFYPIAIALVGILVSIPLIAIYWHLWGRVNPRTHSLIGVPLAISVLLVPVGFRYLFAGLDYPQYIMTNSLAVFSNPIYPPLIIHTLIGAMDIGAFVTASVLATRRNMNINGMRIALGTGLVLLVPQAIAGAYYFTVLGRYDPYIVSNIAGPLLGYDPGTALFYPAFYTAITLTIALGATALYAFYAAMQGRVVRPAVIGTGFLAEAILVLMEYVNDGSRYPYLFLSGNSGIPITQLLNTLIPLPLIAIYTMLLSTLIFTAIFTITLYYAIIRRFLPED
ncbi:cytochrome ubiquinol oxidase subunit I [Vulcanisaeta souniana]|uniref:Cytochrome oxidase subunit I n=1 Tax=Vulcanisaeta souniana JCM 11219 TaxID=1293586 RepID=A0A830E3W2_9CREN|nr:cytochrome ubiquinol oxidase subunit I [Vulcanisaeta souniana]BDR92079.1 cytochrome oxidase subunit I [Vulcanisaeta souniana JCM 11219]GGI68023.1 cytochrome oxidase subunit I [Vulcanisaeta souniana JCM 11219]